MIAVFKTMTIEHYKLTYYEVNILFMSDEVFMLIWLIYKKTKNRFGQTNCFSCNLKKTHGYPRGNQEKKFTSNLIPVCTEEKNNLLQ